MLVLSRRLGETIVIDGNIHLTVIAVKGAQVRIAVEAPPAIRIDRKEVHDSRTQRDNSCPSALETDRAAHG